jgi:acetyl-CoA carboxylase biotin carboxylase subunit
MECRIYAEDPENHFFPSPGRILHWRAPQGPGIRLDEGVYSGWTVPGDYDPLLAKLIAWGANRAETIARLRRALDEFEIAGIRTNLALFQRILAKHDFQDGAIHTGWLDERLAALLPGGAQSADGANDPLTIEAAAIAAGLAHFRKATSSGEQPPAASRWREDGRREQLSRTPDR